MKEKLKRSIIVTLAMVMAFTLTMPMAVSAATKKSITVTMKGVRISNNKATLAPKKTSQLTVKYNGKTVTSKAAYISSNKKVASITKKGKLTAKKEGTCTITIKYKGKSKKLKLTVRSAANPTPASYSIGGTVEVTGKKYLDRPLEFEIMDVTPTAGLNAVMPDSTTAKTDAKYRFAFDKITFSKAGTYEFWIWQPVMEENVIMCNCGAYFTSSEEHNKHDLEHLLAHEQDNYWFDTVELENVHVDGRRWTATVTVKEADGKLSISKATYKSSDGRTNKTGPEFATTVTKPKKK